jgi:DNA-binding LytR/AlgR family response regulator
MVKVGLVEDDPASAQLLRDYLERYAQNAVETFQVESFDSARALLDSYRAGFDVLLLDIQLPGIDGFQAARRIRQVDHQVVIVFVTATPQYALKGYEVDALSYLLKPVSYISFARELDRCLERIKLRRGAWLALHVDTGVVRVATAEIVYLESDKHRVVVHTTTDDITVTGSLKAFATELAERGFQRCNSGYLVNLRHVLGIRANLCLVTGGKQLLISRPRRKAFMAALTDYLGLVT